MRVAETPPHPDYRPVGLPASLIDPTAKRSARNRGVDCVLGGKLFQRPVDRVIEPEQPVATELGQRATGTNI